MKQVGIITNLEGELAEVEVQRHTACKKCGGCGLGTKNSNKVKVKNPVNAEIGNKVYIDMADIGVLKAAAIMYMIPLAALVIGFMFSYYGAQHFGYVDTKELWGLGFGFAFLIGSFILIRKFEPKLSLNTLYGPKILRVIGDEEIIEE
ncbi:SoxR reducing system RseC family protein [Alkalicella caledoniensis]|uniref:SoxR reducing system RseC family protein n=1 Tax=Alkalicella caledoniensis TaxID=2731377 RepID=A0A7G9WAP9_ALKCA|nr:SoxR reducing system RseC family protein [Alkalicella caledoniensis]QNO15761.1 SoxR reducing system RseC family protein [Alkalicella caledoniensis]